jgi:hypothetical protein
VASDPVAKGWRTEWPQAFVAALKGRSPLNTGGDPVTEIHHIDLDRTSQLDLAAFEQAGLWQAVASVLVAVRLPL